MDNVIPLTGAKLIHFAPPSAKEKLPGLLFAHRAPTFEDRDQIGIKIYRMGVREVSTETIRQLIISELYEIEADEAKAEENAMFLEGFWQRQTAYQELMEKWTLQEAERLIDQAEGAEDIEPAPKPDELVTRKERARAHILVTEVTDVSQRLRDKIADQQGYDQRFRIVTVRLMLWDWEGLECRPARDDNNVLTAQCIEDLRRELSDRGLETAFDEVADTINHSFAMDASTEKNFDSPPGTSSPPNGSPTKKGGSGKGGGKRTASDTELTPPAE